MTSLDSWSDVLYNTIVYVEQKGNATVFHLYQPDTNFWFSVFVVDNGL